MAVAKRNEKQKAIGQASYAKAKARKAENIAAADLAQRTNDVFRAKGQRTPYQERKRAKNVARLIEKYGAENVVDKG
jgi:hypothetical protein